MPKGGASVEWDKVFTWKDLSAPGLIARAGDSAQSACVRSSRTLLARLPGARKLPLLCLTVSDACGLVWVYRQRPGERPWQR